MDRYHVETYTSGVPYKMKRFVTIEGARAYKQELHSIGHYCVDLIDLETADPKRYGTRINYDLDDPRSRPWFVVGSDRKDCTNES